MKKKLLDFIVCPNCFNNSFKLEASEINKLEIREGLIQCKKCSNKYDIEEGILDLLLNSTKVIENEQKGWNNLKNAITNSDELMLSLPDARGPYRKYWIGQAENFHYIFSRLDLTGEETVLDLGSGRCWSTRYFSKKGCYRIGLDILIPKYIGLRTSDIYIYKENTYFERVCSTMGKLPFKDALFDIVFIAATLHHSSRILKPLKEIYKVLKPDGRLVLINEPVRGLLRRGKACNPEIEAGINENIYLLPKYLMELKKAGFKSDLQFWLGGNNSLARFINKIFCRLIPQKYINKLLWKPLKYIQLFLFGGVLNLKAVKVDSKRVT